MIEFHNLNADHQSAVMKVRLQKLEFLLESSW